MKKIILKIKEKLRPIKILLNTTIGKKHRLRVIFNIFLLQFRKNFFKGPFVFKTCTNTFAYVQKNIDTSGASGLFYCGLLEADEILCAWHLLRSKDIFFDIGANQGSWGLVLCAKEVYCHEFEPSSDTFKSLKKQISFNKSFDNYLLPHQIAVSNKNGTVQFTKGRGQNNQIKSEYSEKNFKNLYEEVKVSTLDHLAEKYGYPNIIKIDTECFTNEVLEKGQNVLKNKSLKALFIETFRRSNGRSQRSIEMEENLAHQGFYPYFFNISSRKLTPITNLYEGGQDTIYLRHNDENLRLIRESKPIKIFDRLY